MLTSHSTLFPYTAGSKVLYYWHFDRHFLSASYQDHRGYKRNVNISGLILAIST